MSKYRQLFIKNLCLSTPREDMFLLLDCMYIYTYLAQNLQKLYLFFHCVRSFQTDLPSFVWFCLWHNRAEAVMKTLWFGYAPSLNNNGNGLVWICTELKTIMETVWFGFAPREKMMQTSWVWLFSELKTILKTVGFGYAPINNNGNGLVWLCTDLK